MVCRAHVKNGVVVVDEPIRLIEGAEVSVNLAPERRAGGSVSDPLWGLFSEHADLLDEVFEQAMRDREKRQLMLR